MNKLTKLNKFVLACFYLFLLQGPLYGWYSVSPFASSTLLGGLMKSDHRCKPSQHDCNPLQLRHFQSLELETCLERRCFSTALVGFFGVALGDLSCGADQRHWSLRLGGRVEPSPTDSMPFVRQTGAKIKHQCHIAYWVMSFAVANCMKQKAAATTFFPAKFPEACLTIAASWQAMQELLRCWSCLWQEM